MIPKFITSLNIPGGFVGFSHDGVTVYVYNPNQMARLPLWLKDLIQNDVAGRCEPLPPSKETSAPDETPDTEPGVIDMAGWRRRKAI